MARGTIGGAALVAVMLAAAGPTWADTLFGIYGGAGTWQQQYSGNVAAGGEAIDVERDLDLDDDRNVLLYLALEHGVPLLPNLRLNYSEVSSSGFNNLTRTVTFRGESFTVSEDVRSEVDFTQTDVILYYQLLDNVVSLDLGVGARWAEGHVAIASATESARAGFDEVLPMLYGRARVDLPLTGFWVGGDVMALAYDGDRLVDLSAQVGWKSPWGVGAEVGWRQFDLDLDDVGQIDRANIEISGPYAALNFHF